MSPKLKRLSGKRVIVLHVKPRRVTADGQKQTLTIPAHEELDVGTLQAISRQASKYITEAELRAIFVSDSD